MGRPSFLLVLLGAGLAVVTCQTTVSQQPLQNVADATRASVMRMEAADACGDEQSFVYPGDDPPQMWCKSDCPRSMSDEHETQSLYAGMLTIGDSCVDASQCQTEVEISVDSNQTFALWIMPMSDQSALTHWYILRMGDLSLRMTRNVVSVEYATVLQNSYELDNDEWNYFSLAVEYTESAVGFYGYVNGEFKGYAAERIPSGSSLAEGSDPITSVIGDCGTAECTTESEDEDMDEAMIKEVYVYDVIMSSSQVMSMYTGSMSSSTPSSECICPEERPIAEDDITCASEFRYPMRKSRFYSNASFYFAPEFILYPANDSAAYQDGDEVYPLYYVTAPGKEEVSFTVEVMLNQVDNLVIHSRTKYPENGLYISGYNSHLEASTSVVNRVLVPAGGCGTVTDSSYTCVELNDTASVDDIYTYTLDLTDVYPEVTSFQFRYDGLPTWEGREVDDELKAHIITNIEVNGRLVPYVMGVEPTYGPVAGGTELTISGRLLDLSDASVSVGGQTCTVSSVDSMSLVCITSAMDDNTTAIGDLLDISMTFALGESFPMIGTFEYRTNPTVTRLERLETFASAGLTITVTGTNFDSVWRPYLLATANYAGQTFVQENMLCTVNSSTVLVCPYPSLDTGDVMITDWDDVTYSLGLKLDGVQDYEDLSTMLPDYATAMVHPDPAVLRFQNTPHKFKVWQDSNIKIMGQKLFSGCSASDYRVIIGEADCDIKEIDNNGITCSPPSQAPPISLNYDIWHDNPQVVVIVGDYDMEVGWVVYEPTLWDDVALRVAILCIVFGVAMVIFVITLICIEKKRSQKAHEQFEVDLLNSYSYEDEKRLKRLTVDPERIQVEKTLVRVDLGKMAIGRYKHPGYNQKVLVKKMLLAQFATPKFHLQQINTFMTQALSLADLDDVTIQRVLGVARVPEGAYAVYHYAEYPDLKTYLRSTELSLTVGDLVRMCSEISAAMYYMSGKDMVHGDLAARCCVVDGKGNAMLCDNAMSRALFPDDYAQVRGFSKTVPVRWMAPEYLKGVAPTIRSDVWAFAVLCYEILTRGRWPYEHLMLDQVISLVFKGGHPERQEYFPQEIYDLLIECWAHEATDRPVFRYIDQYLDQCMTRCEMDLRRRPTFSGDPMCDVNVRDTVTYHYQVAAPPPKYDDTFAAMAGKANMGFISILDEDTKI